MNPNKSILIYPSKNTISSAQHGNVKKKRFLETGMGVGQEEKGTTEGEMAGWHH